MSTRKIMDAKNTDTGELVYFKSHAKATYLSDGTTVEDALGAAGGLDALPVGTILHSNEESGNVFGDKWLPCDGSVVSSTDYPDLVTENKIVWNESVNFPIGITHMVSHNTNNSYLSGVGYGSVTVHSRDAGKTFTPAWDLLLNPYGTPYESVNALVGNTQDWKVYASLDASKNATGLDLTEQYLVAGAGFYWGDMVGADALKTSSYVWRGNMYYDATTDICYAFDSDNNFYKCDGYEWSLVTTSGLPSTYQTGLCRIGGYLTSWWFSSYREDVSAVAYRSSDDGVTWSSVTTENATGYDFGMTLDISIANGKMYLGGLTTVKYTTDGVTFNNCIQPESATELKNIIYVSSKNKYYAVSETMLYVSDDGVTWQEYGKIGNAQESVYLRYVNVDDTDFLVAYNSSGECYYTDLNDTGLPVIENAYIKVLN